MKKALFLAASGSEGHHPPLGYAATRLRGTARLSHSRHACARGLRRVRKGLRNARAGEPKLAASAMLSQRSSRAHEAA
jgi:hypothetical protein